MGESLWVYSSTVPEQYWGTNQSGKRVQLTRQVDSPEGEKFKLSHNMATVTIDGKDSVAHMESKHTAGTKAAKSAKTGSMLLGIAGALTNDSNIKKAADVAQRLEGVAFATKEVASIHDQEFLRDIAFAGRKRVRVTLNGSQSHSFDLNGAVQVGINQTVELYDAMEILNRAGQKFEIKASNAKKVEKLRKQEEKREAKAQKKRK